jgi:hypothetical protein
MAEIDPAELLHALDRLPPHLRAELHKALSEPTKH